MKTKTKEKSESITIDQAPTGNLPDKYSPPESVSTASQQIVNLVKIALNNPKLDVRKMREIMDMQMEAMRFQAEISFNHAMRDCQASIPQIEANCTNKHTHSKYANLEAIDTIVRPIISKHGFSLSHTTEQVGERHMKVTCCVRHVDGHKEYFTMTGELDDGGFKGTANKTGIQAAGSSSSYLVRYLIKLIFNVVIKGEDQDGNKNKPENKKEDDFNKKVKEENQQSTESPPPARPVDEDWKPEHGVSLQGRQQTLKYNQPEGNSETHAVLAFRYLKAVLAKRKHKSSRIALVTENAPLLRALSAENQDVLVAELHQLADAGE